MIRALAMSLVAFAALCASAEPSTLKFLSAGAAQALVRSTAGKAGITVEGSFGAVGAMKERVQAGEQSDIVILRRDQIDDLAAKKLVVPGTVDLGIVPTSIGVRASDPSPSVTDEASLRAALLAADAIYIPDPAKATAGIHFMKVLDKLGIREQVAARIRPFPDGATAMHAMVEASGHPIGCTQATEIRATPGMKVVADLPKGFDLVTVYSGAVSANASDRAAASKFLAGLADRL
ncbi:MAG TPA: substrate-binding domain-containing protein [Usitatibacter sp.]|nr:substrate-binding domain-containing protein [Usitatibacter sp.]